MAKFFKVMTCCGLRPYLGLLQVKVRLIAFYIFWQKRRKNTHFIKKWLDLMLLIALYLVTIATDSPLTLLKRVSRIHEQFIKTIGTDNKCSRQNRRKITNPAV